MLQEPRLEGSRREHVGEAEGQAKARGLLVVAKGGLLAF